MSLTSFPQKIYLSTSLSINCLTFSSCLMSTSMIVVGFFLNTCCDVPAVVVVVDVVVVAKVARPSFRWLSDHSVNDIPLLSITLAKKLLTLDNLSSREIKECQDQSILECRKVKINLLIGENIQTFLFLC
jgi:hypothetical protein